MSKIERTLSIIKPDAVERNLSNEIVNLLKKNNLKILQNKKIHITKEEAADFYKEHQSKPFYDSLCNYLSSGPIIVMELSGENAIQNYRTLMGATDPKEANKNTIRQLYGVSIDKNSVHGSDSSESANRELNFFFKDSNS
jgi:nucleoside-diphosphate kinase